jgi:hypothetical protein
VKPSADDRLEAIEKTAKALRYAHKCAAAKRAELAAIQRQVAEADAEVLLASAAFDEALAAEVKR